MNSILKDEQNSNKKLKIFYGIIIVICIISIICAIIYQIRKQNEEDHQAPIISNEGNVDNNKTEFNNIFENKVNYLENNSYRITKLERNKEIVYTGFERKEQKVNDYELDVNIPYINIKNENIEKINQQIKDLFENKAKSILNSQNNDVIYTVKYSAYITNNILSIVIRATLKEGTEPQRDIVQTYNYDLTNQKEYTIQEILNLKGITENDANKKIKEQIQEVQKTVSQLGELGYNVYSRDIESDIYKIENVTEYFIGKNNTIYIVFAYGNTNNTTEMDIVVM